jgi:hypothetical protein
VCPPRCAPLTASMMRNRSFPRSMNDGLLATATAMAPCTHTQTPRERPTPKSDSETDGRPPKRRTAPRTRWRRLLREALTGGTRLTWACRLHAGGGTGTPHRPGQTPDPRVRGPEGPACPAGSDGPPGHRGGARGARRPAASPTTQARKADRVRHRSRPCLPPGLPVGPAAALSPGPRPLVLGGVGGRRRARRRGEPGPAPTCGHQPVRYTRCRRRRRRAAAGSCAGAAETPGKAGGRALGAACDDVLPFRPGKAVLRPTSPTPVRCCPCRRPERRQSCSVAAAASALTRGGRPAPAREAGRRTAPAEGARRQGPAKGPVRPGWTTAPGSP